MASKVKVKPKKRRPQKPVCTDFYSHESSGYATAFAMTFDGTKKMIVEAATTSVKDAKRLRAWLDRFIAWAESECATG